MSETVLNKTALVLSAGGLFCAYQAGFYKAIAGRVPIDLVVGASAGALNGWPIASGCSPELLIEQWLDPDISDVLRLLPNPGFFRGYFDNTRLRMQTEKATAEFQPRIPYGVALVELPSFRTVVVQHPSVTARHLEATCAIPLVLPSVKIEGKRYIDGGLISKLPFDGAVQMGATRIIAIDSLPDVNLWWLRYGTRLARSLKAKPRIPAGVEILTFTPSEPLGDAQSAVFWKRENIERWIDLGYRDGLRAHFPESGISK